MRSMLPVTRGQVDPRQHLPTHPIKYKSEKQSVYGQEQGHLQQEHETYLQYLCPVINPGSLFA